MSEKTVNEELKKSIDSLVEELFVEETSTEETIEKGKNAIDEIVGEPKQSDKMKGGSDAAEKKMTADEGEQPKKNKKDERPVKEVHDQEGSEAKGYETVQSKQKEEDVANAKGTIAKSEEEETVSLKKSEYEELLNTVAELKKSIETKEEVVTEEVIEKAEQPSSDLIKSMVTEAVSGLAEENAELKKSLNETQELIKSLAKKPVQQKSITNVQALEKSFNEEGLESKSGPQTFSKSEILDAAEELVKSKKISMEQVIELENTGRIYDANARKAVEDYLNNK